MSERATDVVEFLSECSAGTLIEKLSMSLSDAGLAQVYNDVGNKKAVVGLQFTFQQLGENDQVMISCKINKSIPTKRGKKAEEDTTDTVFFVGKGGKLSVLPPKEENSGQTLLDGINSNNVVRSVN
jgi:hypothetical protein